MQLTSPRVADRLEISTDSQERQTLDAILGQIGEQIQQQFTGRLDIRNDRGRSWSLYFRMGRLLWASESQYARRRWRRQYFLQTGSQQFESYPDEKLVRAGDRYECWDYHLLMVLNVRQGLKAEFVQRIVAGTAHEVLFDLFQEGLALFPHLHADRNQNGMNWERFTANWRADVRPSDQLAIPLSWADDTQATLAAVRQQWLAWQQAGLGNFSPHLAPSLRRLDRLAERVSGETYRHLQALINGDRSLYDLAALTQKDLPCVGRSLVSSLRSGDISLQPVADLPLPKPPEPSTRTAAVARDRNLDRRQADLPVAPAPTPSDRRPLIAYIDDSPQCQAAMEPILTEGGYRFLPIEDPVQALPLLLENLPDLILLDLVMPVINGYEMCAQIRKVARLQDTPVVIVTSQDGLVDRVRAKLVGANDFTSKPIERSSMLIVAQRFARPKV